MSCRPVLAISMTIVAALGGACYASSPTEQKLNTKVATPKCVFYGVADRRVASDASDRLCQEVATILREKGIKVEILKGQPTKYMERGRLIVGVTASVQKIDGYGDAVIVGSQFSVQAKVSTLIPNPAQIAHINPKTLEITPEIRAALKRAVSPLM